MNDQAGEHQVTIIDEHGSVIELISTDTYEPEELTASFVCSSGEEFGGTWRGIPVRSVLDAAEDDSITHLVFVSSDGFQVCLPVADAFDAIVATDRIDAPGSGLPRLIAPSISGTRTIKDVHLVQLKRLTADDEPEDFETMPPSMR